MSPAARRRASDVITRRLVSTPEFHASRNVACYISMPDEVETSAIIARGWAIGKRMYAPAIDRRGLMQFRALDPDTRIERNDFGIWEPVDSPLIAPSRLDIVVTPLTAFDRNRHRVGMGAGYFDCTFAFLRQRRSWFRPKLIGVAFACQEVKKILPNPWDIPLHRIITESS